MDRGAWRIAVGEVTKSLTRLSDEAQGVTGQNGSHRVSLIRTKLCPTLIANRNTV